MSPLLLCLLSTIIMAKLLVGNVANIFIALVNCIDWTKRHKISTVDGLLTALALSRIVLLWVMLLYWHQTFIASNSCSLAWTLTVHVVWILSTHFSIWVATSLCIFYLLKIANFSSLLFLYLKWRVHRVLVVLLLGSLPFLISQSAVVILSDSLLIRECKGNITQGLKDSVMLAQMTVNTLANLVPFTVSLICFLLLIFSLGRHLQNMQLSGKGARDPSTQVHLRALQTVVSFLLLFACYFLAFVTSVWNSEKEQKNQIFIFCWAIGILYPSSHSCVLIWGNRKLKEAFLALLWQLKCCWKGSRSAARAFMQKI